MKRDMDLVRAVLLAVEEHGTTPIDWIEDFQVEGYESELVAYHVWLLAQAGFIEAIDDSTGDRFGCSPRCLTWHGAEFLDSVRDPIVWSNTKQGAKRVGSFSIDVLSEIAKGIIKKKLADLSGVEIDL